MAGTGGLPKYLRENREDQFVEKVYGVEFEERIPVTFATNPLTLTGTQYMNDLLFTALTGNAITGPTAADLYQVLAKISKVTVGNPGLNRFTQIIQNTDPVNAKVITFGAGFNPASITIPPSTISSVSWEIQTVNPPTFMLFAQSASVPAGGPVTSYTGAQGTTRSGAVVALAGDLTPAMVSPVAQTGGFLLNNAGGAGANANVQTALTVLDLDKVTLRDAAGAIGTGAAQPGDIEVAIAPGDAYVPSNNTGARYGHIGAFNVGLITGASVSSSSDASIPGTTLSALDVFGQGATPQDNLISSTLGAAGSPTNAFALCRTDSRLPGAAFGEALPLPLVQSNFRAVMSAAAPATTGAAPPSGAFAFSVDQGAANFLFYVNAAGNVFWTPTAGGAFPPVGQDGAGMLSLVVSQRKFKNNIKPLTNSASIHKLLPQQFFYNKNPELLRHGFVVEDILEAGLPQEYLFFEGKKDKTGQFDVTKPTSIDYNAIVTSCVAEIQLLRKEVDALKAGAKAPAAAVAAK